MMHLQYIADKFGHTTAVQIQIPIEEWVQLKKKYKEFEEEELSAEVSDWQVRLGKEELKKISDGTADIIDWEHTQHLFRI